MSAKLLEKIKNLWNPEEEEEEEEGFGNRESFESAETDVEQRQKSTGRMSPNFRVIGGTAARKEFKNVKIVCSHPKAYNQEITGVADELINGNIVIVDLEIEEKNPEEARRILDFLRGSVHAKHGKFMLVSKATYLMTPGDFEIDGAGAQILDEINAAVTSNFT